MTTKELIRAEIGRLEKMDYPVDTYEQSVGFYNALDRIKAFLDTLQDESITTCNELEEAEDAHIRKVVDVAGHPGWDWETQDIADASKAGVEWQKAKMLKDNPVIMSVEDFQALIDSHAKRVEADYKEKMMEGAANTYILKSYNPVTEQGKPTLHAIELVYEDEGKPYLIAGQNARIIILPKED